ncbi:hypothetical protein CCACVL1_15962 [Corchorus capsularis]|uniref:Alpha-D-phosphohexomutase alpha/beta/alpha domain-containing protein n=1 Tax=Corchorus capsularis TaxID=210143 RepID=A0A1R3I034_COCAP|nr:hypothetical protein CCACVL1_15962 [Corchorus capsularis]
MTRISLLVYHFSLFGILAALRSLKTQSVVGLMITASQNKVTANGVKIVDPSGGMHSQYGNLLLINLPMPQLMKLLLGVTPFSSPLCASPFISFGENMERIQPFSTSAAGAAINVKV